MRLPVLTIMDLHRAKCGPFFANFGTMTRSFPKRGTLLLLLSLLFSGVFAQNDVKDRVVQAIGRGNASGLAADLMPNVDLTLPDASDFYSKAQAQQILRKFFDGHAPRSMSIAHQGNNSMGESYYIGNLATANGDFRVTFFLKKNGDAFLVKQLRIENAKP